MSEESALEEAHLVGPATAPLLAAAGIAVEDLLERRVTHADLVAAGVNKGVAARIRRAYSLPWSTAADADDLDRRAAQVRGLDEQEREWVAVSASDWTDTLDRELPEPEPESDPDRTQDRDPVTTIRGIGGTWATRLEQAGITSVKALARADPDAVAAALDIAESRVHRWHEAAVERQE